MTIRYRDAVGFFLLSCLLRPGICRGEENIILFFPGVSYGEPLRSTAEGTIFSLPKLPGFTASAHVGQAGAKLGAGIYTLGVFEPTGPGYEPWFGPWQTLAVRAVVARTWGSPLGVSSGRTLIGAEVEYSVMFMLNAYAGVLFPIHRSAHDDTYVFSWGIGLR